MSKIYTHAGGMALGDTVTLTNYFLHESMLIGEPIVVSRKWTPKPESMAVSQALVDQLITMFDSTGSITWTDEPGNFVTEQPKIWSPPLGYPRLPFKLPWRWDGGSHKGICMQIDGRSGAAQKNPRRRARWLLEHMPGVKKVGLPMTLDESIAVMRRCSLFIGVDSGMSHIAHAVGIPMIIIEYLQPVLPWQPDPHGPNPWSHARGTKQAMAIANELFGMKVS